MPPSVLITRPAPFGAEFAAILRDEPGGDLPVVLSPALLIEAAGPLPDLAPYRRLIFTSRHGVRRFTELSDRRDIPCIAVGDATAGEARRAGLDAVSARGDAGALVARIIATGVPGPMLHLRGRHGAGDVAGALRAAGVSADEAVIYAQHTAPLGAEARALLRGAAPVIAPLFSPRSADALFTSTEIRAPVVVLALSAAVASRVPSSASAEVIVAASPDTEAMLRAWPDAVSAANRLEGTKRAQ